MLHVTRRLPFGDRAISWLAVRPARYALVVFVFAFGVYAATASVTLHGYDPETAATAEGFFHTGDFRVLAESVFVPRGSVGEGVRGKNGKLIGRAGLPEPLFMMPFYAAGWAVDKLVGVRRANYYHFRNRAVLLYNPVVTALTAALLFLIVLRLRSLRWAVAIALVFTVASIAWPYSKIGMDNTVMLGVAVTLAGAVYASAEGSAWLWALAGFGAGMTVAAKPYEAIAVGVILLLLLWRPLVAALPGRRAMLLLAVVGPLVLWAVAIGWYDWLREGSVFKTGAASYNDFTFAAPLNAIGFYFSPGKGLLFYSPLVALGVFGLVRLWKEERRLAAVIAGAVAAGTVVVSVNGFWTDETWGPRYLVPIAWLLLIPIPWWATTRVKQRILSILVGVAVGVQLVGVVAPYEATRTALPSLVGYPIYRVTVFGYAAGPFGNDSIRWIPQLSPLLVQSALIVSWVGMKLGAPAITYSYAPFLGPPHHLTMNTDVIRLAGIPDFWWRNPHLLDALGLTFSLVLAGGSAALLTPVLRATRV